VTLGRRAVARVVRLRARRTTVVTLRIARAPRRGVLRLTIRAGARTVARSMAYS
jgi:hypothetical protein